MATIRHKSRKSGWLRVLMVAAPLMGLGLLTAGPGSVAQAARFSGDRGGGGMSFRGGPIGHQGRPAMRSMGGRGGGFRFGGPGAGSDFGAFHGGGSGTMFGNSLAMRGLMGMGNMQYRPLPSGPSFGAGAFGGRQPQGRLHAANPLITGNSGYRLLRGGEGRLDFGRDHGLAQFPNAGSFGRDRDFGQFRNDRSFDRDHNSGRSDRDRFFDFGRYDHFRDFHRFDHDGFARYHQYGYYRFRFPVEPYYTYGYPDEFLFGNWFGANTYWWWGHVLPGPGVTVVLQF